MNLDATAKCRNVTHMKCGENGSYPFLSSMHRSQCRQWEEPRSGRDLRSAGDLKPWFLGGIKITVYEKHKRVPCAT